MLIRIDDIREQGLVIEAEEGPEKFPALADLESAGEVRFTRPLRMRLLARRIDGMVEVEGELATGVELSCSRCLVAFGRPLESRFALTFTREVPPVEEEEGEGVELSPEDLGLIPFEGDEIDLTEALQEQVVVALPMRPLCDPGCRGLCPYCGADLNQTECGCEPPVFNNRFAALKDLKIDDQKD